MEEGKRKAREKDEEYMSDKDIVRGKTKEVIFENKHPFLREYT